MSDNHNVKDRIIEFLKANGDSSTETIAYGVQIPTYAVIKHLKQLQKFKEVTKTTSKVTSYWRPQKKS